MQWRPDPIGVLPSVTQQAHLQTSEEEDIAIRLVVRHGGSGSRHGGPRDHLGPDETVDRPRVVQDGARRILSPEDDHARGRRTVRHHEARPAGRVDRRGDLRPGAAHERPRVREIPGPGVASEQDQLRVVFAVSHGRPCPGRRGRGRRHLVPLAGGEVPRVAERHDGRVEASEENDVALRGVVAHAGIEPAWGVSRRGQLRPRSGLELPRGSYGRRRRRGPSEQDDVAVLRIVGHARIHVGAGTDRRSELRPDSRGELPRVRKQRGATGPAVQHHVAIRRIVGHGLAVAGRRRGGGVELRPHPSRELPRVREDTRRGQSPEQEDIAVVGIVDHRGKLPSRRDRVGHLGPRGGGRRGRFARRAGARRRAARYPCSRSGTSRTGPRNAVPRAGAFLERILRVRGLRGTDGIGVRGGCHGGGGRGGDSERAWGQPPRNEAEQLDRHDDDGQRGGVLSELPSTPSEHSRSTIPDHGRPSSRGLGGQYSSCVYSRGNGIPIEPDLPTREVRSSVVDARRIAKYAEGSRWPVRCSVLPMGPGRRNANGPTSSPRLGSRSARRRRATARRASFAEEEVRRPPRWFVARPPGPARPGLRSGYGSVPAGGLGGLAARGRRARGWISGTPRGIGTLPSVRPGSGAP
jgi:hypothetical protein